MKLLLALVVVASLCYVYSERCTNASTCVNTLCDTSKDHVHIECTEKHCTCSNDKQPCLSQTDCDTGRCIESHGDRTQYHCLDGVCTCIKV